MSRKSSFKSSYRAKVSASQEALRGPIENDLYRHPGSDSDFAGSVDDAHQQGSALNQDNMHLSSTSYRSQVEDEDSSPEDNPRERGRRQGQSQGWSQGRTEGWVHATSASELEDTSRYFGRESGYRSSSQEQNSSQSQALVRIRGGSILEDSPASVSSSSFDDGSSGAAGVTPPLSSPVGYFQSRIRSDVRSNMDRGQDTSSSSSSSSITTGARTFGEHIFRPPNDYLTQTRRTTDENLEVEGNLNARRTCITSVPSSPRPSGSSHSNSGRPERITSILDPVRFHYRNPPAYNSSTSGASCGPQGSRTLEQLLFTNNPALTTPAHNSSGGAAQPLVNYNLSSSSSRSSIYPGTPFSTGWSSSEQVTPNTSTSVRSMTATPGTSTSRRRVRIAIAEGRGHARGDIGMACLGERSPSLILAELSDSQNFTKTIAKLHVFEPTEIIMAANDCLPTGQNRLFMVIRKEFPNVNFITIQRKSFNPDIGLVKIKHLVNDLFSSVPLSVSKKYYVLAAAAALLDFLETELTVIIYPKTLKIEFQGSENTACIDAGTVKHLELLHNLDDLSSPYSLLGVLDHCKTSMGSRLLRTNLLQPPFHEDLINQRLDCVEELVSNTEFLYGIESNLCHITMDVDHVISTLIKIQKSDNEKTIEQRANFILALKHILQRVAGFARVLKRGNHPYFRHLATEFEFPVYSQLMDRINAVINEEANFQKGVVNMGNQRAFAVKAEVNAILDVSRQIYCELVEDINCYVLELSRDCQLPLQVGQHPKRGMYIHFKLRDEEMTKRIVFPPEFLQVRQSKERISFTTQRLLTTNKRINELLSEILHLSDAVITELLGDIRQQVGSLYKVSDALANLDMLQAFGEYSRLYSTVRPKFSLFITEIFEGQHPILASMSLEQSPISNDTFLSTDVNVNIITGPNMSGKTTYLKQVALLQVLAQIGCFVPAKEATIRIVDAIFSRLSNQDSIEGDASTFTVEMHETNHIIKNITKQSLVIIDELGRGTGVEEATAMSWAIVEELMQKPAFILVATHFLGLAAMEYKHLRVINYKMETIEEGVQGAGETPLVNRNGYNFSKLTYTHRLRRGVTDVEHYGLKLARRSSLPPTIVDDAEIIAKEIIAARSPVRSTTDPESVSLKTKFLLGCQIARGCREMQNASKEEKEQFVLHMQTLYKNLCLEESRGTSGANNNNQQEGNTANDASVPDN